MAQAPNNPFSNQNQYENSAPRQPGNNALMWVLGTMGVVFLLGVVVCCGGGYFAYTEIKGKIDQEITKEVDRQFSEDPVFQEHIGELETASMNLGAIGMEAQKAQDEGTDFEQVMVFDVEGSKGSGQIILQQDFDDETSRAILRMDDGTEYEMEIDDEYFDRMGPDFDSEDSQTDSDSETATETELEAETEIDQVIETESETDESVESAVTEETELSESVFETEPLLGGGSETVDAP